MKGTIVESTNIFTYNGYYLATIKDVEEVAMAGGNGTVLKIEIDDSSSQFGESFWLTNLEDAPKRQAIDQLTNAVGVQKIPEGADANFIMTVVQKTIGKKVAVLMLPQANKKTGKMYHKLAYVTNVPTLLPSKEAGKLFTGEVASKPSKPTRAEETTDVDADDLPF